MKYTVNTSVRLPVGSVLGLTESQASSRRHLVQPLPERKGWYRATQDVCFKAGEVILSDDNLLKTCEAVVAEKPTAKAAKD